MAAETIAFLDEVIGGPVHLVGHGDGAVVGALVAMHRADTVARLILIGQYFSSEGQVPGGLEPPAEPGGQVSHQRSPMDPPRVASCPDPFHAAHAGRRPSGS